MTHHCHITDEDGDTIKVETPHPVNHTAVALISVNDQHAFADSVVALNRNQLLELKKAVDAAYKEIDK